MASLIGVLAWNETFLASSPSPKERSAAQTFQETHHVGCILSMSDMLRPPPKEARDQMPRSKKRASWTLPRSEIE